MHAGNNVGGCIKKSSISLSGASISVSCMETEIHFGIIIEMIISSWES